MLLNIWGHIATVPVCSSGTLTNVLPHRNPMPQTQDTTLHPVTVYRHRADLCLGYPLMWKVTLEYTATHFGSDPIGKSFPSLPHTPVNAQFYDAGIVVLSQKYSRKWTVPTDSWTRNLRCANPFRCPLTHTCFLNAGYTISHTVFDLITAPALITTPPWLFTLYTLSYYRPLDDLFPDFLLYFHLLSPTWRSFRTSGREQIYVSAPGAY